MVYLDSAVTSHGFAAGIWFFGNHSLPYRVSLGVELTFEIWENSQAGRVHYTQTYSKGCFEGTQKFARKEYAVTRCCMF